MNEADRKLDAAAEAVRTPRIRALKVNGHEDFVARSLEKGVARMSWGYTGRTSDAPVDGDLHRISRQIEENGWNSLHEEDQDRYQSFLLDLQEGDWVVYINVPSYGRCTAARLTGGYYWDTANHGDCNHCLPVDPESVAVFDRNDARVDPMLSARLKLLGRWWRITVPERFFETLERLSGDTIAQRRTPQHNIGFWLDAISDDLASITRKLHESHPNTDLEKFLEVAFRSVGGGVTVERRGGRGDRGADLLVTVPVRGLVLGLDRTEVCVVQVKSYTGTHSDTQAVADIERAFDAYPKATQGLIVSTAADTGEAFDRARDVLIEKSGKRVATLVGRDLALFLLETGAVRGLGGGAPS